MSIRSLIWAKLLLLLNIPLSLHTLFYLAIRNGLSERVRLLHGPGSHRFPGSLSPLRTHYSGFWPVDRQLTTLVAFFAEAIDGSRPGAVIQAVHFSGQFAAAGLLLTLEGARRGNVGKLVTWSTLFGNLAQNVSFGLTAPTYFFIHLLSTTTTSAAPTEASIAVPAAFAASIPLSFTLGYLLPSVLLLIPAPKRISYDAHQIAVAAWQLFPVYIALLQMLLQPALKRLFPSLRTRTVSRPMLRGAYMTGIILASLSHIGTLSLGLTHVFFPSIFHRSFPKLSAIFVPSMFWPNRVRRISSMGAGAQLLLQWDEIDGSLATFIWAAAILSAGMAATHRNSAMSVLGTMLAVLGGLAVLGPCGAAVGMVWARDEMLFASALTEGEKKAN